MKKPTFIYIYIYKSLTFEKDVVDFFGRVVQFLIKLTLSVWEKLKTDDKTVPVANYCKRNQPNNCMSEKIYSKK